MSLLLRLIATTPAATVEQAGGYGSSPAIARQRERRRRRILEQLRRGEQPPIERLQEALETTVASAQAEPEASAEMLTMAKGYLSAVPQNNSAQIILALATLAELEAALQAASLMKQAQLIREEEEMLAFLLLTA